MLDPVIITGVPRSRTSMSTAIFYFCGLQLGEVSGPNSNNKKGQFENRKIIDKIEKAYLKSNGFDPMGQHPLPKELPIDPSRKQMVLNIMKKQVDLNEIWGFKDSKSILSFNSWLHAFPNSKWIIIHRKKDDIVKSCQVTPFMKRREDWGNFVDEYRKRFDLLKKAHPFVYEISSDEIVKYQFDKVKYVVEELGLTWNEPKILDFVDPTLTRVK